MHLNAYHMTAGNTKDCVTVPVGVWDFVIAHILADQDAHHSCWLDLVRLSWTCRAAYKAARQPLWRHLRLVFRFKREFQNDHDIEDAPAKDQYTESLRRRLHQQVYRSSVFPKFNHGQLKSRDERLVRIRQVSKGYAHLLPFVVTDGKLYLASLLENERNPNAPNFDGLMSLWDDDSASPTDVRVVGGLVLVPYPLHLVDELTIDALSLHDDGRIKCRGLVELDNALPFLFVMDPSQIRDYHFYASSAYKSCPLFETVGHHFTGAVNHDYFLAGTISDSPTFGPSAQSVRIYNCGQSTYKDFESAMCSRLSRLPCLRSFELCGEGHFDLTAGLFTSSTITRLVLDYTLKAQPQPSHPALLWTNMPALMELTINFELAKLLFVPSQFDSSAPTIFPNLTHLTLLDIFSYARNHHPLGFIPWTPYYHMPRLMHFQCPAGHRGFPYAQAMVPQHLHALVSHTRLESFVAPLLITFGQLSDYSDADHGDDVHDDPPQPKLTRVTATHLTHIDLHSQFAGPFTSLVKVPALESATLSSGSSHVDTRWMRHVPNLTRLHLKVQEFNPRTFWPPLARRVPQLTHLTVVDTCKWNQAYLSACPNGSRASDCDSDNGDDEEVPKCPPVTFANLESLSFTMHSGTYDFANLCLPRLKHLNLTLSHPITHALASVFPQLESLTVAGDQCPIQARHLLDHVPARCRVKLAPTPAHIEPGDQACAVAELRLRFAGDGNRHVWRALLDGDRFGAWRPVGEKVGVWVEQRAAVRETDKELVASVVEHLMGSADREPVVTVYDEALRQ